MNMIEETETESEIAKLKRIVNSLTKRLKTSNVKMTSEEAIPRKPKFNKKNDEESEEKAYQKKTCFSSDSESDDSSSSSDESEWQSPNGIWNHIICNNLKVENNDENKLKIKNLKNTFSDNSTIEHYECYNINNKKQKVDHLSTITLAYVFQKRGNRKLKNTARLKVLVDTGCGSTLINHSAVKKLKQKVNNGQKWMTKVGSFSTSKTCKVTFALL